MKILCKISLTMSIIFLAITILITLMCSFFNYYVIIGSLGTGHLLSILTAFNILFFVIYILTKRITKNFFISLSIVFLVLAEVILLLMGFSPNYKYSTHISNDNTHTIVVEEKTTNHEITIRFYKKIFTVVYKPVHHATFVGDKKDMYELGNYTIAFDDKHTRITVPLANEAAFLVPHSK